MIGLTGESRELRQSRNIAVIIATLTSMALLYLGVIKQPADDLAYQDAQVTKRIANQQKHLSQQKTKRADSQNWIKMTAPMPLGKSQEFPA